MALSEALARLNEEWRKEQAHCEWEKRHQAMKLSKAIEMLLGDDLVGSVITMLRESIQTSAHMAFHPVTDPNVTPSGIDGDRAQAALTVRLTEDEVLNLCLKKMLKEALAER